MVHDVVVRGGVLYDGSGATPVRKDVAIRAGIVVEVGEISGEARSEIVADGLSVAPGFIDTHTHSDAVPQLGGEHDDLRLGSARQGVTTEICGNCGFSLFPVPQGRGESVRHHLATVFGPEVAVYDDLDSLATDYERRPMATNLASLVGQGTLRAAVMGFDRRPAKSSEIGEMARLAEEALAQGAVGLSTGLLYPPGSYADQSEVAAVAAGLGPRHRPYVSHVRNEMDAVGDAVSEALSIASDVGAPAHISHLKAAGNRNHGRMPELLDLLDTARRRGEDVTADVYPYTAGSTVLHALLPPWSTEGGVEATSRRLGDPAALAAIRRELADPSPPWQNLVHGIGWGGVRIASARGHEELEGRTLASIAASWDTDPVSAVAHLLRATGSAVTIVAEMAHAEDMSAALRWEHTTIGSDGIPIPGKPHPRWAGSFARTLRLAQEEGLFSTAEAIRKMTSQPARRFGLSARGRLSVGAVADLVVFDEHRVADRATFDHPLLPPDGIEHVIVGGAVVISSGEDTGLRPGRFLRWEP